jgi:hypothetical protein
MHMQMDHPLRGYVLLPARSIGHYRGIGLGPFEPTIIEEELQPVPDNLADEASIWRLYKPGWRQTAYRLYEENAVHDGKDGGVQMLASLDVARQIQNLVEPHIGPHEILACAMWHPEDPSMAAAGPAATVQGYDIAYPGGDYYSAILNGLFINPSPWLLAEFGGLLNDSGLFSSLVYVPRYIRCFKKVAKSERASTFATFQLSTV